MTKADLTQAVQRALEVGRRDATQIVDQLFAAIAAALVRGEQVKLSRFGLLTPKDKPARTGRDPRTGGPLALPAHRAIGFRASPRLKALLTTKGTTTKGTGTKSLTK